MFGISACDHFTLSTEAAGRRVALPRTLHFGAGRASYCDVVQEKPQALITRFSQEETRCPHTHPPTSPRSDVACKVVPVSTVPRVVVVLA